MPQKHQGQKHIHPIPIPTKAQDHVAGLAVPTEAMHPAPRYIWVLWYECFVSVEYRTQMSSVQPHYAWCSFWLSFPFGVWTVSTMYKPNELCNDSNCRNRALSGYHSASIQAYSNGLRWILDLWSGFFSPTRDDNYTSLQLDFKSVVCCSIVNWPIYHFRRQGGKYVMSGSVRLTHE